MTNNCSGCGPYVPRTKQAENVLESLVYILSPAIKLLLSWRLHHLVQPGQLKGLWLAALRFCGNAPQCCQPGSFKSCPNYYKDTALQHKTFMLNVSNNQAIYRWERHADKDTRLTPRQYATLLGEAKK